MADPDLLGLLLADVHRDDLAEEPIHRRDDGHASRAPAEWYVAPAGEWPAVERAGIGRVRGDVLEVGCGAGRASLWLQERGHDVLAVDRSPRAVAVASDRGVDSVAVAEMDWLPVTADEFDTVLFAGKQFALGADPGDVAARLRRLYTVVPPGGRVVADLDDPSRLVAPEHAEYAADREVADGVAHRRFRLEYDGRVGPWQGLLSISRDALGELAASTGWLVAEVLEERDGPRYWVVLERVETERR